MRFLLDECAASRSMRAMLAGDGHDVASVAERGPQSSDGKVLAMAHAEDRVLITQDKDFGELVFAQRMPHPCIVRFTDMTVEDMAEAMRYLIERHADAMQRGAFIVVAGSLVRIRDTESAGE